MPPKADPELEERILKAAQKLCRTRGEGALTLRAVARQAGTTTPTVYKRFRNKQALRVALANRIRDEINQGLMTASSLEEVCRMYVQFAEERPAEYMVLRSVWAEVMGPDRPRPARQWIITQLAQRFGGRPEDYSLFFFTIYLVCQGANSLLTVPASKDAHRYIRENCMAVCETLIKNVGLFQAREPLAS